MIKKFVNFLLILSLTACSVTQPYDVPTKQHAAMLAQIKTQGAQVIENGFNLRIILPNDQFFIAQTDQLQPQQQPVLAQVAAVILSYNNPQVAVFGYTDELAINPAKSRQVSYNKAHVIAALLWKQGISPSIMTVQGLGNTAAVAENNTPAGSAANRRVEILVSGQ